MTRFKISTTIDKPADIVVEALNNPENFPYWQTNLEKFEVVKGEPNQVSSVGRLHYSQKGRSYIMEDKLIYCEPGKRYISEVSGDAITAKVETTLDSSGDKTKMSLQWEGKGKKFFLNILLPFLRGNISRQVIEELETFKELVETKGANLINPIDTVKIY